MEFLSFILSTTGLVFLILTSLLKSMDMKKILILVFSSNIMVGVSYLLVGAGINGAVSCFIGGAQTIVNYFFTSKNKPIPVWLIGVYSLLFLGVNLAVLSSAIGIIAILASLSFIGCISSKTGKMYRTWQITNSVLWIVYDVLAKSYGPLSTHVTLLLFAIVGMIINDFKRNKKILP